MSAAEIPRMGPTLEKRTFHSFRHTFAKRALESGAQSTWLSRHLGHSSLKVTTDIYGHWERAERKLQAAKMERAFPVMMRWCFMRSAMRGSRPRQIGRKASLAGVLRWAGLESNQRPWD
jgi:Phage integrase family